MSTIYASTQRNSPLIRVSTPRPPIVIPSDYSRIAIVSFFKGRGSWGNPIMMPLSDLPTYLARHGYREVS